MELPNVKGHVFWLLFSDKSNRWLNENMKRVRKQVKSPSFIPHLTLLPAPEMPDERVFGKLDQFTLQQLPFQLPLTGIGHDDFPYQAFYLEASRSIPLLKLRKDLAELFGLEPNENYRPHVSLLYGSYSENEIEMLKALVAWPESRAVDITEIALVRLEGRPEEWEVIYQSKFGV